MISTHFTLLGQIVLDITQDRWMMSHDNHNMQMNTHCNAKVSIFRYRAVISFYTFGQLVVIGFLIYTAGHVLIKIKIRTTVGSCT